MALFLSINFSYSADKNNSNSRELFLEKINNFRTEDFQRRIAPKVPQRNPEIENAIQSYIESSPKLKHNFNQILGKTEITDVEFPEKIRTPGEFDESQAVVISWPSYAFDAEGDEVDPYIPGYGVKYNNTTKQYELVPIDGYIADLFDESPIPPIWKQLTNAIQYAAEVWIRIPNGDDSTYIKQWMAIQGTPLFNYKFIVDENGYNAFWMRDFGPFGIYIGDEEELAFVNFQYYPPRVIDNMFPKFLADKLGYKVFDSPVEIEGGNFMTDGHGLGFYSDVLYYNNSDTLGAAYEYKEPLTKFQVDSMLAVQLGLHTNVVLPHLQCDGGTGHIDLYLKMMSDNHIFIANFPDDFNRPAFYDYNIVKNNKENIKNLNSRYNDKLILSHIPVPTDDFGNYSKTTCQAYDADPRNFINGLVVNNTFIFPSYTNATSGYKQAEEEVLRLYKRLLPDFRFVPIDCRDIIGWGGAIHCVTMQIPVENSIQVIHEPLREERGLKEKYTIQAEVYNHSGIAETVLYWKLKNDSEWNSVEMNANSNVFVANIDNNNFTEQDTIEYYIQTRSNNGKIAFKPISGEDGPYAFSLHNPVSVEDFGIINNRLSEVYPNPAEDKINFSLTLVKTNNVELFVSDVFGTKLFTIADENFEAGLWNFEYSIDELTSGIYFLTAKGNDVMQVRKIIISK